MSYTKLITKNSVVVTFSDGTTKTATAGTGMFQAAVDALIKGASDDELKAALDGVQYIKRWAQGNFTIEGTKVTWVKKPEYVIPEVLRKKLFEHAENGWPADAFVAFLDRLLQNPSNRSVETFYGFIEQQGLTIDSQGFVIGYKGLREDMTDVHTGSFDNTPGREHSMERNHVDDNPNNPCSRGFHFGGFEYASNFGQRLVLVRVDPVDLVCVPFDCSQGKVRTCRYTVLREIPRDDSGKQPGFYSEGSPELRLPERGEDDIECQACGTWNEPDAKYCKGCGVELDQSEGDEELVEETECSDCGEPRVRLDNGEWAPRCMHCGAKFD